MPSSDSKAHRERVEPMPGDLDNFFAWAQDTGLAKGPVKETLRLIERNCREMFEFVFKRKHGDAEPEETKESLEGRIRKGRKLIEYIEALEEAFAQMPQISEYYELALAKRGNGRNTFLLANIMLILESQLEDDEENLRTLKKHKKPASGETLLLRHVADFLFQHHCNPAHAREITRLLICHDTKLRVWANGEKLAKEHRRLMDGYGVHRRRRPRAGR